MVRCSIESIRTEDSILDNIVPSYEYIKMFELENVTVMSSRAYQRLGSEYSTYPDAARTKSRPLTKVNYRKQNP